MLTCEPTSFLALMIFMLTTSNNFYAFSYSNNQYIQDRVESVNWGGGVYIQLISKEMSCS